VGPERPNTVIMGSNCIRGTDEWTHLSVLYRPVSIEALRRDDPSSKKSYQISSRIRKLGKVLQKGQSYSAIAKE
jgi:hypothetical protein